MDLKQPLAFLSLPLLVPLTAHGHPSLAPLVEKVMGGVVNIRTADTAGERPHAEGEDPFVSLFLKPSEKKEGLGLPTRSMGSGFFYRDSGTIITNHHVIKDAAKITVFATDLNVYRQADIIGRDPDMDLAVLKVRPVPEAVALRFGSSESMRPGDHVFAIGNPFGYGNTVSSGILSAKGRSVGGGALSYLLQTDLPLNPGNSGGPLFNLKGEVIGINSANVVAAQGISFAIPSELAKRRIDDMLSSGTGQDTTSWLGFAARNLYDEPQFSPESYGVVVTAVSEGSPADKAGLRKGDLIRKIGTLMVRNMGELEKTLTSYPRGSRLSMEIYRAGKKNSLLLKPTSRPSDLSKAATRSGF